MRGSPGGFTLALKTTMLDNILTLLWMLICVVVVIVLAYLFTRFVAGRGGAIGLSGSNGQFKVLARLSLGREQSAALVKAGERYFLLGAAPSGITLLAELTAEEAAEISPPPDPDQPAPPSFGEALRTVLKQKKPR